MARVFKDTLKNSVFTGMYFIYFQIGVNVIGLPEFSSIKVPKYITTVVNNYKKYHK